MDFTADCPLDIDVNDHAKNILKKLDSMRREQRNCDLIISVEGEEIHVNRDVMCAASDYFDAMFSHDTKEKQEGVVEMKDVEFSCVEKCIDFIYSGKISVSEDECEGLLYSASLMQLNEVCGKISPFLESRLTSRSFFNIRRISLKFSLKTLNEVCDEFALDQLFKLAGEKEFNDLDVDYISFLLSSKKSSSQRVEDSKLAVALQWIKASIDKREKHLMKMIKLLDMSKLTSGYVMFLVKNESLCIRSAEFMRELLIGIGHSHNMRVTGPPDLSGLSSTIDFTSRNSLIIFDESSKVVQLYQPLEKNLTRMNAYHSEMNGYFISCIYKEYLYVFNANKKVFRLNISEKNSDWIQTTDMLHDHGIGLQCTVHENFIYVGGNNKMERYKTEGNEKWEDVDLAGYICNSSAMVSFEEGVFLIGGYKGGIALNVVKKFSPSSSTSMSVKSMNMARQSASATVFDGKIYVAGGVNNVKKLSDFEMYDSVSDSWTILPKMNLPRYLFGLCLMDDQIFAIGSWLDLCSFEVYDSEHDKWILHHNAPEMKIRAPATVAAYTPINK